MAHDSESGDSGTSPAMHIGEVADRTDLSIRSLRHWEEVGLLTPSGRTEGGFRLYTDEDIEKILVIRRMKPLGFTLDEMKDAMAHLEILRDPTQPEPRHSHSVAHLAGVRSEAGERRKKLVRQLEMADEFLEILEREIS